MLEIRQRVDKVECISLRSMLEELKIEKNIFLPMIKEFSFQEDKDYFKRNFNEIQNNEYYTDYFLTFDTAKTFLSLLNTEESRALRDEITKIEERHRITLTSKIFLDVHDVSSFLGFHPTQCYSIMKKLNKELKQKGHITFRGKINKRYFLERIGYFAKGDIK